MTWLLPKEAQLSQPVPAAQSSDRSSEERREKTINYWLSQGHVSPSHKAVTGCIFSILTTKSPTTYFPTTGGKKLKKHPPFKGKFHTKPLKIFCLKNTFYKRQNVQKSPFSSFPYQVPGPIFCENIHPARQHQQATVLNCALNISISPSRRASLGELTGERKLGNMYRQWEDEGWLLHSTHPTTSWLTSLHNLIT